METKNQPNLAKFTFLYLLSLVTLVMTALAVGNVLFELINKFVADPLASYGNIFDPSSIKFGIATLVIAGPIYFWSTWHIFKSLSAGLLDREAEPRRWLTYLIILISAFVMVGWLIGVLFSFLNGEMTLRFVLKGLVSLLLAGGIFGFYFYDVRRATVESGDRIIKYSVIAAMVVVLASLVASFMFVESPTLARNRRHDVNLISNFDQIDSSLNSYFLENRKLPATLDIVLKEKRNLVDLTLKDPLTGEVIEYKVLNDKKYELCGTFLTSNIGANPTVDFTVTRWPHGTGRQCLTQQIFQNLDGIVKPIPVGAETLLIK